ncbi:MAG: hypothetical protein VW378_05000 [bacterium]
MTDNTLLRLIKEAAYTDGSFVTRAGKKTDYYIDKYLFTCQPHILAPLIEAFLEIMPDPKSYDHLMAPALGAIALAAPLAYRLEKSLLIFEQLDDTAQVHGDYQTSDRILVLEDVLTSGSTVLDLCRFVATIPLTVTQIISVIDREEGAHEAIAKAGFRSSSLISASKLKHL